MKLQDIFSRNKQCAEVVAEIKKKRLTADNQTDADDMSDDELELALQFARLEYLYSIRFLEQSRMERAYRKGLEEARKKEEVLYRDRLRELSCGASKAILEEIARKMRCTGLSGKYKEEYNTAVQMFDVLEEDCKMVKKKEMWLKTAWEEEPERPVIIDEPVKEKEQEWQLEDDEWEWER